ncbi:MAG: PIN domain-containing protein [Nanoarchaeota archaeon]|nr:PIN domain-containing protein [Nanoarchaeota archaeon]
MEVLIDTNFVISCILKRIEFLEELAGMGFKVVVPREVILELKDLKTTTRSSGEDKTAISVALEILESKKVKKKQLGGTNVDEALIKKGKEGIYIATLDKGILRQIPNRIIIDAARKKLIIDRE